MGFLDNFERSVERLVGGSFAKAFASGIHPGEILSGLKREIDARSRIVSRTRILAPHSFHVSLSATDRENLQRLGDGLTAEIAQALRDYATLRGYAFSAPLSLDFDISSALSEGILEVTSRSPGPVVWIPTVTWDSVRYPIVAKSTMMGRGTDSDIHIVASGVSRHHAEIRWNGKRAEVVDLGSTNGTTLEGTRVTRAALPDTCTLGLGQARILFQVVPQARSGFQELTNTPNASREETS